MCYLVCITKINTFKVLSALAIPFKSKVPTMRENPPPTPVIMGEVLNPDRIADRDIMANIKEFSTYHNELRGDVNKQKRQGITVVNNNDPLPKNATPAWTSVTQQIYDSGTWMMPRACCRRSNGFAYPKGKFVNKRWDIIADMSELDLFRLCFPEKYIIEVVIPETNNIL